MRHTRERSLQFVCKRLYFWCVLCSSEVPATRWNSKLGSTFKVAHLITLYTTIRYVCNFLRDDFVISSGTKPDVNNVARGPDQERSLDCFTHVMIDDSRISPRSVLQADTIIVSCVFLGRRSAVTKFGNCAVNLLQRPTATSFSKVSRTTTPERATVVQNGWSTKTKTWRYMLVRTRGSWSLPRAA